jgi:amino acid adenylation domain-containing protein
MDSKIDEIIKRRSNLSPAKQAILAKRLRGQHELDNQQIVIPRRTQQSSVPLSAAQQRLWFLQQLEPQSSVYNEFACIQLKGVLNFVALKESFNEIVKRHESLRTSFETLDEQPVQVIHPTLTVELPVVRLTNLPQVLQNAEVERLTAEITQKPFDLASIPLLRGMLLQISEQEHLLLLVIHHIACDGWSIQVLNQELAVLYEAFSAEKSSPLSELPIQYADYSIWQHQLLQGEREKTQVSYWKEQLAGASTTLLLPTDRQRPLVQSFRGATKYFKLLPSLTGMLRSFSNQQGVTLFMVLLAAFQAQLYRYTSQEDICVGSPIANRNNVDIEGLIGFFVNTLVLRTDLSGNPSFLELLNRVREVCIEAYAHADLPFERLVGELHPERNLSHTPLFQVTFALQEDTKKDLVLSDLTLQWLQNNNGTAKFDLTLYVVDSKPELWGWWEYNTDLFDAATIERMVGHFTNLLKGVVSQAEKRLSDLPLLTEPERQKVLVNWNNTATDYPQDKCIHELFEAQVEETPDAIAVIFETEQLTYQELNARANQLAHYLQKLGVKPEVLVGICVERSLEMVIGLLGILKSGGAYVPLDPAYPPERLNFILKDTQVSVLLTQQHLIENLPQHPTRLFCLDTDWENVAQQSSQKPISKCTIDNLAYIIYTSGSTGQPKGVLVNHSNVVRLFAATEFWYNFKQHDVWTLFHSIAFDFSVWEIWGALLYGGQLIVVPYWLSRSPEQFYKLLLTHKVTILNQTPSAFRQLMQVEECLRNGNKLALRKVIFGGEALQLESLRPWFECYGDQSPQLINMYGITETTVHVTSRPLRITDLELASASLIGRPIDDLQVYLLDRYGQPVPIGVPGEMYVGGPGVVRGYLNRPKLTSERFIPNRFSDKPNGRLYKSGDLARYLPNGDIEYLGRIDHQVKIRGFRIELGEIEAIISQYLGVRETVVIVSEDSANSQRIIAYVVPQKEQTLAISELRSFLKSKLPNYMIPAVFIILEAIPLTANGKVDRKALPTLNIVRPELEKTYIEPQTKVEKELANIWAEVLNLEKIEINENFFELGGHSLLATQVISRIHKTFDIELPLRRLFEFPTVTQLAKKIEEKKLSAKPASPIQRVSRKMELPLSFAQQRLWFLHQLDPSSYTYNGSSALLLKGSLNVQALEQSIHEIVRRHEILRTYFQIVNGRPIQLIAPALKIPLPIVDLQNLPDIEHEAEVKKLRLANYQQPFNLVQAPLLRLTLLQLKNRQHVLLITTHHIIYDAWSEGVFFREVSALYEAFSNGKPSALKEINIQYADFAAWQQNQLQGEVLETLLTYWKKQLGNNLAILQLPTISPISKVHNSQEGRQKLILSKTLSQAIKKLSDSVGTTLFITLLTAFKVLLHCYTGDLDIVIGTDIANRNRIETENLIGFFINQLVLRSNLSGNPAFSELLLRVRKVCLEAYAHQDLPFDKLVSVLNPKRHLNQTPLFQVKFILQNAPIHPLVLSDLTLTHLEELENTVARFDLLLELTDTDGDIMGFLKYRKGLFDDNNMVKMLNDFEIILSQIIVDPTIKLNKLKEIIIKTDKEYNFSLKEERKQGYLQKLKNIQRKNSNNITIDEEE